MLSGSSQPYRLQQVKVKKEGDRQTGWARNYFLDQFLDTKEQNFQKKKLKLDIIYVSTN